MSLHSAGDAKFQNGWKDTTRNLHRWLTETSFDLHTKQASSLFPYMHTQTQGYSFTKSHIKAKKNKIIYYNLLKFSFSQPQVTLIASCRMAELPKILRVTQGTGDIPLCCLVQVTLEGGWKEGSLAEIVLLKTTGPVTGSAFQPGQKNVSLQIQKSVHLVMGNECNCFSLCTEKVGV